MKAILIARVSTEEQRDAGNSLPAQVVRLERYCQSKGFQIIKICSFDESAYSQDRSEFDKIIDFILKQKEKVAVCADKVDRISRNVFDKRISILYEKALIDEIELHFVSENQIINSRISAVEKFQFSISLGLAKYYSDAISDNVKRAQEQKVRKGEWLSRAPYGYKNVKLPGGNTDIVVDEYQAAIIKKIFELYASGAYSMGLICQKLKDEHNIKLSKGSLGKILNNPFYCGTMRYKIGDHPHRYPTLISQSVFNQVQEIKNGVIKKPFKYGGLPYVYRGLIRCAVCGLAITPEKHKGLIYYHCTQYNGKHNAIWLREEVITETLGEAFKKIQVPENILDGIKATLNQVHKDKIEFHNKEFDKLTKEQKATTKMIDNLYMDKLSMRITTSEYDKYYQILRDQIDEITIKLENLQEAEDNYYITSKYILDLTNRAYDLFTSSEVENRRLLIKLVLSNLRIDSEKLLYDIEKPFDVIAKCSEGLLWLG